MIALSQRLGSCLFLVTLSWGLSRHSVQAEVSAPLKEQIILSSSSLLAAQSDADHKRKLRTPSANLDSQVQDGTDVDAIETIAKNNLSDEKNRMLQDEMAESEVVASDATETEPTTPEVEESNDEETTLSSAEDSTKRVTQEQVPTTPLNYRAAWVAHGTIAAIAWGLFVPFAIGSAWFRDLIPTYWIYIHVFVNVSTFALTFFAVGIAFATMKSMGEAGEGHLKERHHVVGLALMLLVSFQTANGFLRPPREYVNEDDDTNTEMGDSTIVGRKSVTPRTIWYLFHSMNGLILFCLGTWQVMSGLNIFSLRFATANWSSVYLGYVLWVVVVFLGIKFWMKYKERQVKLQAWRHGGVHDPENDLAPVQYE